MNYSEFPKVVIFDFDGTVADTMPSLAALAMATLASVRLSAVRDSVTHDVGLQALSDWYWETSGLPFSEQLETVPLHLATSMKDRLAFVFEAIKARLMSEGKFDCTPGFRAFFTEVTYHARTAVVSSSSKTYLQTFIDRHWPMSVSVFDWVGGIESGAKADQIAKAVARFCHAPEDALFIGDSLNDYRMAVRLGVRFRGYAPADRPSPFPPDVSVITAWSARLIDAFV